MDIKAKAREIAHRYFLTDNETKTEAIEAALREAYKAGKHERMDVAALYGYEAGYRAGLERAAEIADEEIAREAWLEGLAIAAVSKAIRAEMGKDNEST